MQISDLLSPADVLVNVPALSKRELLEELAEMAGSILELPADRIATELLKREDLGSTGTGGGIALPHAKIEGVEKPFALLARLKRPIDFEAVDDEPVDVVAMLLLPTSDQGEHLGALACIARRLGDPGVISQVRQANGPSEAYSAVAAQE